MREVTTVAHLNNPADGYIVIAPFSASAKAELQAVQDKIAEAIPRSALWLPEGDQLHVTFAHIVSPDASYKEPRGALFEKLRPAAEAALEKITPQPLDIAVTFDTIQVFAGAIIIKGYDDGTINRMRTTFAQEFQRPQQTRPAPDIIHTTIARFVKK